MNIKNLKNIFILTIIVIISYSIMSFSSNSSFVGSSIIGAWISDKDNNWRLVFTSDNKCYNYYKGVLTRTSTYSISNTSPQCGQEVDTDIDYLQLTNIKNGDKICYEITSLTEQDLALTVLDQGAPKLFSRQ